MEQAAGGSSAEWRAEGAFTSLNSNNCCHCCYGCPDDVAVVVVVRRGYISERE